MADLRQALTAAIGRLGERVEAEVLLAYVLGQSRSWLFAHTDEALDPVDEDAYRALVARRVAGEPMAYITGHRGFWSLELEVTPATLIPRPETELLVELALRHLPAGETLRVADLGTGSGAIALAIAHERPQAQVSAVDVSADALAVARRNALRLGIGNIRFLQGSWMTPLSGESFAVIVSNPPYIEAGDPHLEQGDLRFEPAGALASGTDGLDAIRHIVTEAPAHLQPGGWLLMEHGWDQGPPVRALLTAAGYVEVETVRDLEGRDRVSCGRFPG